MRIDRVRVRDFQGLHEAELELGSITLIYGPNGAGKSSLADAIRHALTGEATRGGALPDLIRQGAKSMEVEVHLEGGWAVTRRRTKSAGEVYIRGVQAKAGEAERDLERAAGVSTTAVAAALEAGRILTMKPDDLQGLLARITGASLDAAAIQKALGAEVIAAAKRVGVPLPATLEGFADSCKKAEGARQLAKRTVKEREADLARLPEAEVTTSKADVEKRLRDLRARRDKAIAAQGRSAGNREALEARLVELRKAPAPDPKHAEIAKGIEEHDRELGRLDAEIRQAEQRIAQMKVGEDTGEAIPADLEEQIAKTTDRVNAARRRMDECERKGSEQKALLVKLDGAKCGGDCPVFPETTCPLNQTDLQTAAKRVQAIKDILGGDWRQAKADHDTAATELTRLQKLVDLGEVRREAAEVAGLRENATALEAQVAVVTRTRDQLRETLSGMGDPAAFRRAQEEIARLEAQIPKGADVEPVEPLDAGIEECERALAALASQDRRSAATKALDQARQQVADADAVAKACGEGGARARLLAQAVAPFTDAANAALAQLATGYAVELDDSMALWVRRGETRLRPEQLSDGERVRLLSVLQYAVTKLAGVGVLVLDRTELVDDRGALKRLAARCSSEGMQVLMLTCAPAPASVPPGVMAYAVRDGRAERIAAAAAA